MLGLRGKPAPKNVMGAPPPALRCTADEPQQLQPSTLLDLVDREHEESVVIEELLRERLEQIFERIARAALGLRVGLGGRDCERPGAGWELV